MRGDAEKAISSFEVAVEHGHYQAWWLWLELPAYAAIRDDPRFVALTDEIKTNVAAQRARLKQIKSEAGP